MATTFEQRLTRLADGNTHPQATPVAPPPLRSAKSIGPIAIIVYGFWGLAFAVITAFMNVNYERLTADMSAGNAAARLIFFVGIGFFALTLIMLGLTFLMALVQSLFRKTSKPNWLRLGLFIAGLALGGLMTRSAPNAIEYVQVLSFF